MISLQKIYAQRVFTAKFNTWNKITDDIYYFSKKGKIDPFIILSIYYIEGYFRPPWFQFAENVLHRINILDNPSIGPFQVRLDNLTTTKPESVVNSSLKYIESLLKRSHLTRAQEKGNFATFGELYNLDKVYGYVLFELYKLLKHEDWVISKQ